MCIKVRQTLVCTEMAAVLNDGADPYTIQHIHRHPPHHKLPADDDLPEGWNMKLLSKKAREAKLEKWILKGIQDESDKQLIRNFIHESKMEHDMDPSQANIDAMMTPYPLSRMMAARLSQILSALDIMKFSRTASSFAFMDPMGGSGADTLAICEIFHGHVCTIAADVDPVKVQHMRRLLKAFNNGTQVAKQSQEEHSHRQVYMGSVLDLADIPYIDVLYLDPPWPLNLQDDEYMIGTQTMTAFIENIFKVNPRLQVVVCKVSKDYERWPMDYPTKNQLVKMCTTNNMRMEEFWPGAYQEGYEGQNGWQKGHYLVSDKEVVGAPNHPVVKPWNNAWNEQLMNTREEVAARNRRPLTHKYGGVIRDLIISKHKDLNAVVNTNSRGNLPGNGTLLDVSTFM